ncbi:MAG: ribonuclease H-like domain-containing protein [Acidobacteria bacterium]|nr:ribonuclease H-like domain-containing protein [Acidobacteriota bacterium]
MSTFEDRLSRVAALRPKSGMPVSRSIPGAFSNSERLIQMLGGECCANRFGCHIRVRRHFPQSPPAVMSSRALRLLAPDSADSVFDSRQWLFLDTETTGLAGGTGTYAFLVGLAWWEEDGLTVEQYFMRDYAEESSLLLEVAGRLDQRRVLVTFNGKSFDWPLLQTRFQIARVRPAPEPLAHLDLLHPARQIWRLSLQSVALTRLERCVLKLDRGSDIPSETIPQRYFDFLRGSPAEAMAEVFNHNQLDLYGLASLALRICAVLDNPEDGECGAGELFGISRILQRRGDHISAERICQRALAAGLPEPIEQAAQRELAFMAKRGRNYELSNSLWEKLLGDSTEGLKAYEQLAIYYEHRASMPHKAASLSREALVELQEAFRAGRMPLHKYQQWHASFQHRLSRLTAKTAK